MPKNHYEFFDPCLVARFTNFIVDCATKTVGNQYPKIVEQYNFSDVASSTLQWISSRIDEMDEKKIRSIFDRDLTRTLDEPGFAPMDDEQKFDFRSKKDLYTQTLLLVERRSPYIYNLLKPFKTRINKITDPLGVSSSSVHRPGEMLYDFRRDSVPFFASMLVHEMSHSYLYAWWSTLDQKAKIENLPWKDEAYSAITRVQRPLYGILLAAVAEACSLDLFFSIVKNAKEDTRKWEQKNFLVEAFIEIYLENINIFSIEYNTFCKNAWMRDVDKGLTCFLDYVHNKASKFRREDWICPKI